MKKQIRLKEGWIEARDMYGSTWNEVTGGIIPDSLIAETRELKTIREWFQQLPEGIRERALRNMDPYKANKIVASMQLAIGNGFSWFFTPENPFWEEMFDHYAFGKPLPPLPPEPLDFDWSVIPAWHDYIAMDMDRKWFSYGTEPKRTAYQFWYADSRRDLLIPSRYAPKNYPGDWKDSLRKRP